MNTSLLCPLASRYTYHVVVSAASMPSKCMGIYQRFGLIEVDHHERPIGYTPERIADTHGCKIIETWERSHVGTTEACAVERAKAEAQRMANELIGRRALEAAADTLGTDVKVAWAA